MDKVKILEDIRDFLLSIKDAWGKDISCPDSRNEYMYYSMLKLSIGTLDTVMWELKKDSMTSEEKDDDYPMVERTMSPTRSCGIRYVGQGASDKCAADISKLVGSGLRAFKSGPK